MPPEKAQGQPAPLELRSLTGIKVTKRPREDAQGLRTDSTVNYPQLGVRTVIDLLRERIDMTKNIIISLSCVSVIKN